jgi:uncharacterized protein (UPF0335 family)
LKARNDISDSLKEAKMTLWTETIPVAEAAERLLAFVREIRQADDEFEQLMRRKAEIYRQAKKDGYNKLAVKTIANDPTSDDDTKVLRKYLETMDDDELLAELEGVEAASDITELRHVRPAADKRAAEEIANREKCEDFDKFKPLFVQVKKDLDAGIRETRRFQTMAEIKEGEFFIVGGQIAYVAQVGKEFISQYDAVRC